MSFEMPRVVFEALSEAVERFGRSSLARFEYPQIAVCVGDAIGLRDRYQVKVDSARVALFIQQKGVFEGAQPGGKLQNLRRGLRK
jgi:hypothetical protein